MPRASTTRAARHDRSEPAGPAPSHATPPVARRAVRAARALRTTAVACLAVSFWAAAYASCDDPEALAAVAAARDRIAAHGASAWPGWDAAPPVLVSSGDEDCLVAHPAVPEGFEPVGDGVSRLSGHLLPALAATTWPVGGVWSVAVPSRSDLQAFLDQYLGEGTITLDEYAYERTITHEAFHAFQMTTLGGPDGFPRFDGDGDGRSSAAPPTLEQVAATPGFDGFQREQGRALVAALRAPTAGEAAAAVARFLETREAWRGQAPAGTGALERFLEWAEGTARYADVRLALHPPAHPGVAADDAWSELLEQLHDPSAIPSGPRDAYAALGAAQAFALDRLYPGWKARAIPGGQPLEALLRAAVEGRAGVPVRLADLPLATVGVGGERWRVLLAREATSWTSGLQGVASLGGVDGLLFVFPEDIDVPFWTRGAVIPLDISFFDAAGGWLASYSMPLCTQDPCPVYGPGRPYRYALETVPGRLPDGLPAAGLDLSRR